MVPGNDIIGNHRRISGIVKINPVATIFPNRVTLYDGRCIILYVYPITVARDRIASNGRTTLTAMRNPIAAVIAYLVPLQQWMTSIIGIDPAMLILRNLT